METRFIAIPTPPALAGRARDGLLAALAAFRNGSPHGTVMPQLALSPAKSVREGDYGFAWARAIWNDMLG